MTYETVKKLKDAGYSQEDPRRTPVTITNENIHEFIMKVKGDCYIPSLSELIEACGDDLDILERDGDGGWQAATPMTTVDAGCGCCYDTKKTCEQGKTPEEAVASLFLRLNDKK